MKTQLKSRLISIAVLALIVVIIFSAFDFIWQAGFNWHETADRETLFQVSAFNTFSSGRYAGYMTYGELAEHGDFGIGTFEQSLFRGSRVTQAKNIQ